MKTIATIILAFIGQNLLAQSDWVYISSSFDGREYYVKNVELKDHNTYDIWVKKIAPPVKTKNKKGAIITLPRKNSIENWVVSCDDKSYNIIEYVDYKGNGDVEDQGSFADEKIKFIPDSVAYEIYDSLCVKAR